MAFWTDGGKDPKRNFRFQVQFAGVDGDNIIWWAKKIAKPNYTVAEIKHVYLGHTFYYPGKVEWQEISMTLVDPADAVAKQDALQMINKIIKASGYYLPGDPNEKRTLDKKNFVGALGDIVITQLNGDGTPVEKWTCKNCFFKSVKFSDLDYENDDLSTIDLGIRYDYAICEIQNDPQQYYKPGAGPQ